MVIFSQTPLKIATYYGHSTVVRTLIERGADVCYAPPDDRQKTVTALQIAEDKSYTEIIAMLKAAHGGDCK